MEDGVFTVPEVIVEMTISEERYDSKQFLNSSEITRGKF